MAAKRTTGTSRRRRLDPEARRAEIIEAARDLFAERPFTTVSTADVAKAAGVARSLVHHYFGGIRELFIAVASEGVEGLDEVPTAGSETPVHERTAHNFRIGLDIIEAHRQTWLAVVGQAAAFGDPELGTLLAATNEQTIQATLDANDDLIQDTPTTRLALRCFQAFIVEATRAWLTGEATRKQIEQMLVVAQRDLLLSVIPAIESEASQPRGVPAVTEPR